MKTGLYIHVPFCIRKCPYCDFYSVPGTDESLKAEYKAAVIRNTERYLERYPDLIFDTVYFGGGTPSVMPADFFDDVLGSIKERLDKEAEITMELNPKTADEEKLGEIRRSGANFVISDESTVFLKLRMLCALRKMQVLTTFQAIL